MAGHSKWANTKHRKGRQDKKRAKSLNFYNREVCCFLVVIFPWFNIFMFFSNLIFILAFYTSNNFSIWIGM